MVWSNGEIKIIWIWGFLEDKCLEDKKGNLFVKFLLILMLVFIIVV